MYADIFINSVSFLTKNFNKLILQPVWRAPIA